MGSEQRCCVTWGWWNWERSKEQNVRGLVKTGSSSVCAYLHSTCCLLLLKEIIKSPFGYFDKMPLTHFLEGYPPPSKKKMNLSKVMLIRIVCVYTNHWPQRQNSPVCVFVCCVLTHSLTTSALDVCRDTFSVFLEQCNFPTLSQRPERTI